MRIEQCANGFVTPSEQKPARTSDILSRFEFRGEPPAEKQISYFGASVLRGFLKEMGGLRFEGNPKGCPYKNLIMAGSLLVGWTDPAQIERVSGVFCGCTIKYENTEGILSGRTGDEYSPLSHCWRTAIELARLVRFMETKEDVPPIPSQPDNEEDLKKILDIRSEIRKRNEARQAVFSSWGQVKDFIDSTLLPKEKDQLPALPGETETSPRTEIITQVYDATNQLDVGGPEYQEITAWVKNSVLEPLMELVGKGNTHNYLVKKGEPFIINLGFQKTAANCPNKPHEDFTGEQF